MTKPKTGGYSLDFYRVRSYFLECANASDSSTIVLQCFRFFDYCFTMLELTDKTKIKSDHIS